MVSILSPARRKPSGGVPNGRWPVRAFSMGGVAAALLAPAFPARAQPIPGAMGVSSGHAQHAPRDLTVTTRTAEAPQQRPGMPPNPAPAGVLGGQMPPPGGLVLSYSAVRIHNGSLLSGTHRLSPEEAVLTVPNPNQPPVQLRRVPVSSTVLVQGFAVAYGITPWLSLGAATSYVNKSTDTVTFAGTSGLRRLGTSRDSTNGIGDSRIGVQVRLWHADGDIVHVGFGLSLPTGSITETIHPLLPNNTIGTSRAGYSLQLGTGTYDAMPAVTWLGQRGRFGMGAAYRGRMSLQAQNSAGYRWGNLHLLTGWVSYRVMPMLSASFRLQGLTQGAIHGRDPQIAGPGVGANPANIGGDRIDAFAGVQLANLPAGIGAGGVNLEIGVPLYQRANGAHLGGGWTLQMSGTLRF